MSSRTRFERELPTVVKPRTKAELAREGVTPYALRGSGWKQTSYGKYVPTDIAGMTTAQRIYEAWATVPSHATLTGWASLFVQGVDHLDGVEPLTGVQLPVPISWGGLGGDGTPDHIRVLRQPPAGGEEISRFGLRLAIPSRAALDDMTGQTALWRAVATADAASHAGVLDLGALAQRAHTTKGRKGILLARQAVALADPATRSPWESKLRVFYVVDLGLPRPEVNRPIFDTRNDRLVGLGDLLDIEAGHVTEFDGQHHRSRRQHHKDNVREEDLEELNLVVTRADSLDLRRGGTADLARRIRSGRARGLARDRRKDLWTVEEPAWWRDRFGDGDVVLTDAEKAELFGDG
jgi:hypothetical protein